MSLSSILSGERETFSPEENVSSRVIAVKPAQAARERCENVLPGRHLVLVCLPLLVSHDLPLPGQHDAYLR